MRPVALSDESLDSLDEEEFDTFDRTNAGYGRKGKRQNTDGLLDLFDDPDELRDDEELPEDIEDFDDE